MAAGEIFVITDGQYENYRIVAVVRALKDFDTAAELSGFVADETRPAWSDGELYVALLVSKGLVEDIGACEHWTYADDIRVLSPVNAMPSTGICRWVRASAERFAEERERDLLRKMAGAVEGVFLAEETEDGARAALKALYAALQKVEEQVREGAALVRANATAVKP